VTAPSAPEPEGQDLPPIPEPGDPDFWEKYDALTPEQLSEMDYQARMDAIVGTPAEQARDRDLELEEAAVHEAEAILSAELARYDTTTVFFPDPEDPPEPEADL
jgi:hypothetical protein